jgi:hypothetical protein
MLGQADRPEVHHDGRYSTGILPSDVLRRLIRARREIVALQDVDDGQTQPASLDLRGRASARTIRAGVSISPSIFGRYKFSFEGHPTHNGCYTVATNPHRVANVCGEIVTPIARRRGHGTLHPLQTEGRG